MQIAKVVLIFSEGDGMARSRVVNPEGDSCAQVSSV